MRALNMPESEGKRLLCSQFENQRGSRYLGNWEKLWDMNIIGQVMPKVVEPKKSENHERFHKIQAMMLANGGNWAKTQMQLTIAADQYFMFSNKQKLEAACGALLAERQRNIESRSFEFPELPGYMMVVSPGDLKDKCIHLYLWGDANTGKTSFIERVLKDNNVEYCKVIPGTEKLPENATSAEVILIDDALPNSTPWASVIGWTNGTYMTGVYKTPAACKRKVVIVTSNKDPDTVWPEKFKPAYDSRFKTIHVTSTEDFPCNILVNYLARTAPDEVKNTNIKWREIKGLDREKEPMNEVDELEEDLGELIIPETPQPVRVSTSVSSMGFSMPGCESQNQEAENMYMMRKRSVPVVDLDKEIEIIIYRRTIRTEMTLDIAVKELQEPSSEVIEEAKLNLKNRTHDMDDYIAFLRMFNHMLGEDNANNEISQVY